MVGTNAPSAQASSAQHVGGARTSVPRRRVTAGGGASSAAGQRSRGVPASSQGILRFYTDDTPGLKIGPQTVLILTLCFMASVVLLHIVGKVHQTYGGEN
ncbi:Sec61beta family protein [Toxoplasma gondii TgCatPRC2]|uniref:Protein transport protein Sec61 subunit beta n=15 Tax=Toxoplasma gondii TaxID=5811 RepID=B9PVN6_TOXGV|nr:Sec61beta family protein [Toxoplasma gondii ME49]EPR58322.1 Sec61beta family protein [Toxoplasma gondii GT1]ESS29656.1 Sec61beta family protein [Toxoplasma gondii VEG]KAF4645075.1 Sec61beta family protein [Toxoplasma gondii]KFG30686.1 Sec61beta family protein [Toxoplasma gondii GAB2-2007-GAL-DOM2]KFG38640.1 Sec61beta family protein [Toxoplasma gondii FOU]KFG43227.1 Sec61beta family protein [Toxoplasma gondii p89]KFG57879.1 Sec61beta family protein [Toxoplasma gondii RUB]KFG99563.1 Sec61b|eukprot:XP_002371249.1 Sec61beta family protein [Toxoplasma gondii ME49]